MRQVTICEGIYNVKSRLPLRKVIFTSDGKKITRNLFILGDSERKNSKIDVIDNFNFNFSLEEVESLTALEIGKKIKSQIKNCFERNVENEIPFFACPIIDKEIL